MGIIEDLYEMRDAKPRFFDRMTVTMTFQDLIELIARATDIKDED